MHHSSLRILVVLAALCFTTLARAQGLPPDLEKKTGYSAAETTQIEAFVNQYKAALSGDAREIKSSRDALMRPLVNPSASVAFRGVMSNALVPVLTPLASGASDQGAINAMEIAGALAHANSLPILAAGLADKRPAVEYAATTGYRRFFDIVGRSAPAVSAGDLTGATKQLQDFLAKQTDPYLISGALTALTSAARIPASQVNGFRAGAVSALIAASSAQAQTLGTAADPLAVINPLLVATGAIREAVSPNSGMPNSVFIEAAGFAGDLAAAVSRLSSRPDAISGYQQAIEAAGSAAETILSLVNVQVNADHPFTTSLKNNLGTLIKNGNRTLFDKDVKTIVDVLTQPPYSFKADRFPLQ